jgi:thiol-disulfide isomerase/thioredoxin
MGTTRASRPRSSGRPARDFRRPLLIGLGLVAAGLAAVAVALTVAGAWGSNASVRSDRGAAPTVAFRTIDGRDVTLAGLRGHPVAFYFMASWCATCVPEAQAWGSIARQATVPGLEVFVVDVDPSDNPQALAAFRDGYVGAGLHWVYDRDQVLTRAFSIASLDTTVLIDGAGRVEYRNTVPLSAGQLRAALANL